MAADPGEDVPLYWNVHTVADPAGAIRGQIFATPVPEPTSLIGLALVGGAGLIMERRKSAADKNYKNEV